MQASHRNDLHFVRLLAALFVFVGHTFEPFAAVKGEPYVWWTGSQSFGGLGVAIFFILSGYLVTGSRMALPAKKFLVHRILRIVPGLAACSFFCVFVAGPLFTTVTLSEYFSSVKTYIFLLSSFVFTLNDNLPGVFERDRIGPSVLGPAYTLTLEFIWYLLLLCLGRSKTVIITTMTGASLVLVMANMWWLPDWNAQFHARAYDINWLVIPYRQFLLTGVYFSIGSVLSFVPKKYFSSSLIAIVLLLLYVASFKTSHYAIMEIIALPYLALYIGLADRGLGAAATAFGDLTYGIYLYHFLFMKGFPQWWGGSIPSYWFFPICLAACVVMAWLSYRYIERPALKWKERW